VKILVTGGSGFIGQHVIRSLAPLHDVTSFDLTPNSELEGLATQREGDVRDFSLLSSVVKDIDAVVHLAAMADVDVAIGEPAETIGVNVGGTLNVLEAVRSTNRAVKVIHASTIWVYGQNSGLQEEASPLPLPSHIYTASKIAAEGLVSTYRESYGLKATCLRFGIPFGHGSRPRGLIPSLVSRARDGAQITIHGSGAQVRQFVRVEDLAHAVRLAAESTKAGNTYNVAYDRPISVRDLALMVVRLAGSTSELTFVDGRVGDYQGSEISVSLVDSELGWKPSLDLESAIRAMIFA
jgi:UDP-glucose 4-epimerase